MLTRIARIRKPTAVKSLRHAKLRLEPLERRDCPSPILNNVNARLIGTTLVVTGRVQDTNPSSDSVYINGAASGQAHFLDSAGDFEFISSGIQAGWIQVTATNALMVNSWIGSDSGGSGGSDIESYYVKADAG